MTLVVSGSVASFRRSVLVALEEICPASAFTVGEEGVVATRETGGCLRYCGHRAGCNLLDALVEARGVVTVRPTDFTSGFKPERGSRPPRGAVFWSPGQTRLKMDRSGGSTTLPSVVLGHELVHALQHQRGTLDPLDPGEFATVRGENQLRRELRQVPRVRYGTKPVPGYDRAYLDTADRRGCGCGGSGVPGPGRPRCPGWPGRSADG